MAPINYYYCVTFSLQISLCNSYSKYPVVYMNTLLYILSYLYQLSCTRILEKLNRYKIHQNIFIFITFFFFFLFLFRQPYLTSRGYYPFTFLKLHVFVLSFITDILNIPTLHLIVIGCYFFNSLLAPVSSYLTHIVVEFFLWFSFKMVIVTALFLIVITIYLLQHWSIAFNVFSFCSWNNLSSCTIIQ